MKTSKVTAQQVENIVKNIGCSLSYHNENLAYILDSDNISLGYISFHECHLLEHIWYSDSAYSGSNDDIRATFYNLLNDCKNPPNIFKRIFRNY